MRETLTTEERALLVERLSVLERQVARKALRIIEQQSAALARVEETRKVLCIVGSMSLASRLANDLHMPDPVEFEVDEMFSTFGFEEQDEEPCNAATHGPRNSTCTCEDSRDE